MYIYIYIHIYGPYLYIPSVCPIVYIWAYGMRRTQGIIYTWRQTKPRYPPDLNYVRSPRDRVRAPCHCTRSLYRDERLEPYT